MSYRSEDLERGIETLLQANISSALTMVAARWAAIDPVTLPEPAGWSRGYRSWILDLPSTSFPYFVIMVGRRAPNASRAGQKIQEIGVSVDLVIFVVANDEGDANTIAHRYIEAVIDIVQANQVVAGHKLRNFEPETNIVPDNTEHLKAGTSGDFETAADVDYMRLCEIALEYSFL